MSSCPNCGNYWNVHDDENHAAAEARQRSPIILVEFEAQLMDESLIRQHCTACGSEWTGRYKKGKMIAVERYHKYPKAKPEPNAD